MPEKKYGEIEFERRIFPRFIIHLPFTYWIDSRKGEGMTNNASQGGLMVYLPERPKVGNVLHIEMSLFEGKQMQIIKASACVIWQKKSVLPAPKNYKAGLQFTEISEDALNFIKWFEQLWLKQNIS